MAEVWINRACLPECPGSKETQAEMERLRKVEVAAKRVLECRDMSEVPMSRQAFDSLTRKYADALADLRRAVEG